MKSFLSILADHSAALGESKESGAATKAAQNSNEVKKGSTGAAGGSKGVTGEHHRDCKSRQ